MADFSKGFGKRLEKLLEEGRYPKAELARKIGVTRSAIDNFVKGRIPRGDVLCLMARELEVSPDWLISGEGGGPGDRVEDPSYVYVPKLDVKAEGGEGVEVHSEQVVDHLAFRADWVFHQLRVKPENLVLIEAVGDSMEPTICAGDLLLVDVSKRDVVNDAIYCLRMSIGELAVKRIQVMADGELMVRSDNPRYEPLPLTALKRRTIGIVGRVVWTARKL